jgi:S1-C subfamily serine protease
LIGFVLIEFTYFVDVSQFPNVNTIIRFIYFPLVFTIFYRGIAVKRRAFRALLALGFNYLSTFLLALVLTVVLIFNFKPVSWHPRVTMGFIADTGHKDVRVFYVQSSSPADSAGLQAGDKVNSINGTALKSQAELRIFMDTTRAKLLHVNIQRGQTQTIVVTTFQPFERVFKVPAARLGWEEKEIDANSRVIIANVSEDGPGFKGGIRNGDELVTFNGQDINSNQNYLRYTVELYPSLKPGDTADVIIRRASKLVEVRFAVGTSRATRVMGEYY